VLEKDMKKILTEFAEEAEKSLSSDINFQDNDDLGRKAKKLLEYLYQLKVGPRLLLLLVIFSFPSDKRKKLWKETQKAVSINK
jgi:hypothetical protein